MHILSSAPVGGGSINQAEMIQTEIGRFFVKRNRASAYPRLFETEADGLDALQHHTGLKVPRVVGYGTTGDESWLLLEHLEKAAPRPGDWILFGQALARLHRERGTADGKAVYGWKFDNYIGSLAQSNRKHTDWSSFFAEERILPQVRKARDGSRLDKNTAQQAERFCARLDDIFPPEPSALLHGDLWSGNFMFTPNGPAIFDPSCYYGHREMDLAMTKLFGGFNNEFYLGYASEYAPEKNWEDRVDYCNLYPLLVHVNLFGGGYVQDVRSILSIF
jgi:fructosamine-3-kinase